MKRSLIAGVVVATWLATLGVIIQYWTPSVSVDLGRGRLRISLYRPLPRPDGGPRIVSQEPSWTIGRVKPGSDWVPRYHAYLLRNGRYARELTIPFWLIAVPLVFPYARLWPRRSSTTSCRRCGYELSYSRGGRCPECGIDTAVRSASAAPVTERPDD